VLEQPQKSPWQGHALPPTNALLPSVFRPGFVSWSLAPGCPARGWPSLVLRGEKSEFHVKDVMFLELSLTEAALTMSHLGSRSKRMGIVMMSRDGIKLGLLELRITEY